MASPDIPRFPSSPADMREPTVLRVRDPGELIAAVPAMIGFRPRDSLVLVATGGASGRRLGLTVRIDLPPPESVDPLGADALVATAVRSLLLDAPAGAAVIVVGGLGDAGADPPFRGLVDRVVLGLEGHGVDVHTVTWAESTATDARWTCYDPCGCAGVVPDASTSPFTAAVVASGTVVHADREELEELVTPSDSEAVRRREVMLIRAIDEAVTDEEAVIDDGLPIGDAGRELVAAAVADAGAGRLILDDDRVVALAMALSAPAVRDDALLRCAGPDAAAAEQLWTALVREMPDPEAAEPAALLAVSALLRGDGALANVALDRAERAWPGHRLTQLLASVAEAGMRPSQVRACLGQAPGTPTPGAGRGRRRAGGSARRSRRPVRRRRRSG